MLDYKTKKTAQAAYRRKELKLMGLMCPVFKEKCMGKKCASFVGRVYPLKRYNKSTVYRLNSPCCYNAIVIGSIEMEGP